VLETDHCKLIIVYMCMYIVDWGFKEGWIKTTPRMTPRNGGSELQAKGSGFVLPYDISQIKTTHTARTESGFLLEADIGHLGESHSVCRLMYS